MRERDLSDEDAVDCERWKLGEGPLREEDGD
jgi:hypothetical protein